MTNDNQEKHAMSDFKIFYQISFVLFVYVSTRKGAQCDYTNTWVIETDNEENAKRIAKKYDFEYGGKIGSLDGFYLLMRNSVPRRRRRSVLQATRILRMDPSVKWSAQQKILTRVKRDFHDPLYKDQWYLKNNGKSTGQPRNSNRQIMRPDYNALH